MKNDEISKASMIRNIVCFIALMMLIIVLALYFSGFYACMYVADGNSMKDTINDGDVLLVNEAAYSVKKPGRFELVYFEREGVYEGVKRVVGLPGETVSLSGGKIYIDGKELKQDYWEQVYATGVQEFSMQLKADEYFVLGDNIASSQDSRSDEIGPVAESEIKGSPWFCIFPFTGFGFVR